MRRVLPLAFVALVALSGCVGDGIGALNGMLYVRSCNVNLKRSKVYYPADYGALDAPRAYDMHPDFFVAQPLDDLPEAHPQNRLYMRVQSRGYLPDSADMLAISVADVRLQALDLGRPTAVGAATNLRATLELNDTCPGAETEIGLDGTITFTQFGPTAAGVDERFRLSNGDQLKASFQFTVVDRRLAGLGGLGGVPTDPTVQGALSGNFDFIIRAGRLAQAFP